MARTLLIPTAVRPALLSRLEAVTDRVASEGTSPIFVAQALLQALEDACRDVKQDAALNAVLDALGVDDLAEDKVVRRLERPLSSSGTYEGGRWSYPDAELLLGQMETTYRIRWADPPPAPPPPTAPPKGVDALPYAPDRPVATDDWIAHPKFGVGHVVEALGDRIRVHFADRERTLLHRAVVSRHLVEKAAPSIAAAHALLDERLASIAAEWRHLGHDPRKTFEASCIGKPGLHPRALAERCIALVEEGFGVKLSQKSRAYDDEHGKLQRVPNRMLHEHYVSPAGVIAIAASRHVAPTTSDDDVLPGLESEIARRLVALGAIET